jgi:kumamolisin
MIQVIKILGAICMGGAQLTSALPNRLENIDSVPVDLGIMNEAQNLTVTFSLGLNNEAELEQLLKNLYLPGHPEYRKFLSPQEFQARFSPTPDQVNQVQIFLKVSGLEIKSVSENGLLVHTEGTVARLNALFETEIHNYKAANGQVYWAPQSEAKVPPQFSLYNIQSFHGLQNQYQAKSLAIPLNSESHSSAQLNNGPAGGLDPATIRSIYNIPPSLNGSNQTLALFEFDGFTASDIDTYRNQFGLPAVPVTPILIGGFNGAAGSGASEVTLDIQLMMALAPGAKEILVYEGTDALSILNQIAIDNRAQTISSSWVSCGPRDSVTSLAQAENTILKQMAAQGQSFFQASGDSGALNGGQPYQGSTSVCDLDTQPYAVIVGGTTLTTDFFGKINGETTWSGSGGGVSPFFTQPDWQSGAISPATRGSTSMRNVPDVALNADPSTGYAIFAGGKWAVYGGTSAAAPLWAAFTSLTNQQREIMGNGRIGFLNPILYQLGKSANYSQDFVDINSGSNGFYPAVTGFDAATGLGSFHGAKLLSDLSNATVSSATPSHGASRVLIAGGVLLFVIVN